MQDEQQDRRLISEQVLLSMLEVMPMSQADVKCRDRGTRNFLRGISRTRRVIGSDSRVASADGRWSMVVN